MHYCVPTSPVHVTVAGDVPCGWKSVASYLCLQDPIPKYSKPNRSLFSYQLRLANIWILKTLTRPSVHIKHMGQTSRQCMLRAVSWGTGLPHLCGLLTHFGILYSNGKIILAANGIHKITQGPWQRNSDTFVKDGFALYTEESSWEQHKNKTVFSLREK